MTGPDANRPRRCSAEARESANTLPRDSEQEHSAESADALIRLGVTLALSGCDALALVTDTPARGMVEACDCITAAGQHLGLSAEFLGQVRAREGGA